MRCVNFSIHDNICVPVSGETGNLFITMEHKHHTVGAFT